MSRHPRDGPRHTWVVDDYFRPGPRQRLWLGATVTWHHRTVEDYYDALQTAGFTVKTIRECAPSPAHFDDATDELERRRRVPLFLLLVATLSR